MRKYRFTIINLQLTLFNAFMLLAVWSQISAPVYYVGWIPFLFTGYITILCYNMARETP